MEQAVLAKSHSVGLLSVANPNVAKALLTVIITDLIQFLNIGMTMSVPQIEVVVNMILTDPVTKNLKPEDFKVCFDNFKKTGVSYNRIDGQVIFSTLMDYANARMELATHYSNLEHDKAKQKAQLIHPEVIAMYKEHLKAIEKRNPTPKPETEVKEEQFKKRPPVEKSARDKFIQQCFTEFEELHKKNPSKLAKRNTPGQYIDMEVPVKVCFGQECGTEIRPVDQVEYTQIKLTQYDSTN